MSRKMSPEKLSLGKEQLHFSLENSIITGAYCKFHLFGGFYSKCGLSVPTWSCQILSPLPGLRQAHRFLLLLLSPGDSSVHTVVCLISFCLSILNEDVNITAQRLMGHQGIGNPIRNGPFTLKRLNSYGVIYKRGKKEPRVTALFRAEFPKTCSTE